MEWKESITAPGIIQMIKQTVVILEAYHFWQLHIKSYPVSNSQFCLHMQRKLLGTNNVDFDATGQQLIIHSAFTKYLRKNLNKMKQCISY